VGGARSCFTSNYGEASAINELGRGSGLPEAVSGHDTYWWWGPGNPNATTVVAVMPGPIDDEGGGIDYLRQFFTNVRAVARLSNPDGLHNQEFGGHVYLCTRPRRPWAQLWPLLRHYGGDAVTSPRRTCAWCDPSLVSRRRATWCSPLIGLVTLFGRGIRHGMFSGTQQA
jgi:hypothetical protein